MLIISNKCLVMFNNVKQKQGKYKNTITSTMYNRNIKLSGQNIKIEYSATSK